jgi:hypothetical protein
MLYLKKLTSKSSHLLRTFGHSKHARRCLGRNVSKGEIMMLIKSFATGSLFVLLYGCASINTPSSSLIETKPVITIGEVSRESEDSVVFIPANMEFPVEFSVKGNVFEKNVSSKIMVSFKKTFIYINIGQAMMVKSG